MLLRINADSAEPLYRQVAAGVRAQIVHGEVRPGDRLPAARAVASGLDVNLHTVLRAYQELRNEGLVDLRPGRGAVVTDGAHAVTQLESDIAQLGQRAAALGMAPSTAVALLRAAM